MHVLEHVMLCNMLCLGFTEGLETEGLKLHSVPCPALQHPVLYLVASLSEA